SASSYVLVLAFCALSSAMMVGEIYSRSLHDALPICYRVMEKAKKVENPDGEIIRCKMTDDMVKSSIEILSAEVLEKKKSLEEEEDRKSTRLNSSHVSISYAVFCLKKKTDSTSRLDSE